MKYNTKLSQSFYLRPTLRVAKELLGKYIVRKYHGKELVGKIVEVEAYIGFHDPASHAYKRKTGRSEIMYQRGGIAYVYFTYGMYHCMNVVTEREGFPAAVLIRSVEPIGGIGMMKKLTGFSSDLSNLTNGPGKFCRAFAIDRKLNGEDLTSNRLFLMNGEKIPKSKIAATRRIGIADGQEKKWRFYIKGNRWVSKIKSDT